MFDYLRKRCNFASPVKYLSIIFQIKVDHLQHKLNMVQVTPLSKIVCPKEPHKIYSTSDDIFQMGEYKRTITLLGLPAISRYSLRKIC